MLWNPELEEWYPVSPQDIPEDRSYGVLCDSHQNNELCPSSKLPDYGECGWKIGIPRTLDTLCPKCRELISQVSGS